MADSRAINEHYAEIGAELIRTEESLVDIKESNATIIYLSSIHAPKKDGGDKVIKAQCEKISEKYKWSIPADYTITVFEPNCEGMTEEQMRILIFHELMHIEIGMDSKGDDVYRIKGHDLEDFKEIIDRYGTDWASVGKE